MTGPRCEEKRFCAVRFARRVHVLLYKTILKMELMPRVCHFQQLSSCPRARRPHDIRRRLRSWRERIRPSHTVHTLCKFNCIRFVTHIDGEGHINAPCAESQVRLCGFVYSLASQLTAAPVPGAMARLDCAHFHFGEQELTALC